VEGFFIYIGLGQGILGFPDARILFHRALLLFKDVSKGIISIAVEL
jgi:hypothetical protein